MLLFVCINESDCLAYYTWEHGFYEYLIVSAEAETGGNHRHGRTHCCCSDHLERA